MMLIITIYVLYVCIVRHRLYRSPFSVQVIEENPGVAKAWFRRGEAHFLLNDWENSKERRRQQLLLKTKLRLKARLTRNVLLEMKRQYPSLGWSVITF